jgi:archaellum component FlaC
LEEFLINAQEEENKLRHEEEIKRKEIEEILERREKVKMKIENKKIKAKNEMKLLIENRKIELDKIEEMEGNIKFMNPLYEEEEIFINPLHEKKIDFLHKNKSFFKTETIPSKFYDSNYYFPYGYTHEHQVNINYKK